MGSGAVKGVEAAMSTATDAELLNSLKELPLEARQKLLAAVSNVNGKAKAKKIGYVGTPKLLEDSDILPSLKSLITKLVSAGYEVTVGKPNEQLADGTGALVADMAAAEAHIFDVVLVAPGGPGAQAEAVKFASHAGIIYFINSKDEKFGKPEWLAEMAGSTTAHDLSSMNVEDVVLNVGEAKRKPGVKVYGMPPSANAMGPVLLAMEAKAGGLEMCDLMKGEQMKPEFLKMNPFHHIPTMSQGEFAIGESNAILRCLALKHKPELYPVDNPELCALIDFAVDSFACEVYKGKWSEVVYPVMGFKGPPEDQEAANKALQAALETWAGLFLKGKFVGGDNLTIADYKVAPFLFALIQPGIEKQSKFQASDRIYQFVADFCTAVPASGMLKAAGGYSIAELIASKVPDAGEAKTVEAGNFAAAAVPKSSAELKVFAMPPSQTCMGAVMLAMESGKGGLEMCNLMEGEHMKPEFLAMNPYHHIPTLKDGDLAIGESRSIIRYIALKYKPECYPVKDPEACGKIDFAMDALYNEVYTDKHTKIVYPVMGFAAAPENQEEANKAYFEAMESWANHFLQGKFVCGDNVSAADFQAVPYLFAAIQPVVEEKTKFKAPDRIKKYCEDFCAAVPASKMLKEAGGYSISEYIASKA